MNYLIAKTKGRHGQFYKVLSNHDFFSLPEDFGDVIPYEPDHKLDEDCWFVVNKFSEKEYCMDFLKNPFFGTEFNQMIEENYYQLDYLYSYQNGIFFFQKVKANQVLQKKYFTLANAPVFIENTPIIVLDVLPCAIYVKEEDNLYFKNLSSISSIFKGIDQLYREATDQETEAFLNSSFIQLENDFNTSKVKSANRKRIALAIQTLASFTPRDKQSVFDYINEYVDLSYNREQGHFTISNEDELKNLVYGIEQRFYTTHRGEEKRLANSIVRLRNSYS